MRHTTNSTPETAMDAIRARITESEKEIEYPYLDSNGNVSIGEPDAVGGRSASIHRRWYLDQPQPWRKANSFLGSMPVRHEALNTCINFSVGQEKA